jgi:hypothetical protein
MITRRRRDQTAEAGGVVYSLCPEDSMKTITTKTEIASDGMLHLELATGLSPGPADVVIVLQQSSTSPGSSAPSLSGKYAASRRTNLEAVADVREIRRGVSQDAGDVPE